MTHELKTWPEYFQAIKKGSKTFEIRKNDRNYLVGDKLILKEWAPKGLGQVSQVIEGDYTGEELELEITYVFVSEPMRASFGVERGHCVIGFKNNELEQSNRELVEALKMAENFISNGIELGFIRMPDKETPDMAHETFPHIRNVLSKHSAAQKGGEDES